MPGASPLVGRRPAPGGSQNCTDWAVGGAQTGRSQCPRPSGMYQVEARQTSKSTQVMRLGGAASPPSLLIYIEPERQLAWEAPLAAWAPARPRTSRSRPRGSRCTTYAQIPPGCTPRLQWGSMVAWSSTAATAGFVRGRGHRAPATTYERHAQRPATDGRVHRASISLTPPPPATTKFPDWHLAPQAQKFLGVDWKSKEARVRLYWIAS
jgi:hypothetical protein